MPFRTIIESYVSNGSIGDQLIFNNEYYQSAVSRKA